MVKHLSLKAYGKINLGLDVLRKRDDGYHEVRVIMQMAGLYDRIDIICRDEPGIKVEIDLYYPPDNENNLVYKAADLLLKEFQIPHRVHIKLEEFIPMAAGMAEDSSDAVAVLFGVNKMFGLDLTMEGLMKRDTCVGADVPYCVMRGTAPTEGIGEVLTPLPPMPQCQVLIAKPGISVPTKFVYDNLHASDLRPEQHPDIDGMIETIKNRDVQLLASRFGNVLEIVTIKEYPVVEKIKDVMKGYGATDAMMSGNGLTVFGLSTSPGAAQETHEVLRHGQYQHLAKQVYLTGFYNNKAQGSARWTMIQR